MALDIRGVGLLLLGTGVLLLAIVILHFYVTRVLPSIASEPRLSAFCRELNGQYVITVANHGVEAISDVRVEVDGNAVCEYGVLHPGSREVCVVRDAGSGPGVFRVSGTYSGRTSVTSGVCRWTAASPAVID